MRKAIIAMVEAFLMALAVASVSLQIGFKGPDFSANPKSKNGSSRMVTDRY